MKCFLIPLTAAALIAAAPLRADPNAGATPPSQGPGSGEQPGNQGSTGWTGGVGGSFVGTNNGPGSENYQSPVVTGLDLKGPPMTKGPFPE